MTPVDNDRHTVIQEQMALLRLRRLHSHIAHAKAKGEPWIAPLLLGALGGIVACFLASFAVMRFFSLFLPGILGLSRLVLLVVAWVLVTCFFRRRAEKKSRLLASQAQAELEAAVEEMKQRLPQWVEAMGGMAALLDSARVNDAWIVARGAAGASPVAATSALPLARVDSAAVGTYAQDFEYRTPAAVYPLVIVTLGVYFFVWFYKIHAELLRRVGAQRTVSPGLALGLLFVPVFNCLWVIIRLYKVARIANLIIKKAEIERKVSAGAILALLIISQMSVVLLWVCFICGSIGWAWVANIVVILSMWTAIAKVQESLNRAWYSEGLIDRSA